MASRSVFISYASTDRDDVTGAADLLRAGGVKVFLDVVGIDFGERWKDVLYKALYRCERVMVFWSLAASTSQWVEREWRYALELGKKIVPTLLDMTPLPAELAEFQAVKRLRPTATRVKKTEFGGLPPRAPMPGAMSNFGTFPYATPPQVVGEPQWLQRHLSKPPTAAAGRPQPAPSESAPATRRSRPWFTVVAIAVVVGMIGVGVAVLTLNLKASVDRQTPERVVVTKGETTSAPSPNSPPADPKPGTGVAKPAPSPEVLLDDLASPHWLALTVAVSLALILVGLLVRQRRRAPPEATAFVEQIFSA